MIWVWAALIVVFFSAAVLIQIYAPRGGYDLFGLSKMLMWLSIIGFGVSVLAKAIKFLSSLVPTV